MKAKQPNAVDAYVGERVKSHRKELGISQAALSEKLGITFQQLNKCEQGINRVGASRLQAIAEVLQVPIGYFFEKDAPEASVSPLKGKNDVSLFIATEEGLAWITALLAIKDQNTREKLLSLLTHLGSMHRKQADENKE
ncbi:helix-turn-helix domain-containing protein [Rhizobium grahamii]|uniref:Transcriptional regulator n=1 Tax=Rhizobium grahamii TaxID=1120045 RepID=A0A370KFE3_9HYPH|nr:helix-turn-helix transcriptional regulator [Rhizobium grahamii]RDJ03053.1 transcriptional regulator [Rhizobium grahamii]